MAAISGFAGRVTIGSTNLTATRWQAMWKTDALDVTCFEAQGGPSKAASALDATTGWLVPTTTPLPGASSNEGEMGWGNVATPISNWAAGITDIDVSVDCYWDTTIVPFSATPIFAPGLVVVCSLSLDRSNTGRRWGPVAVLIDSATNDAEVRGVIKYSFTGKVAGIQAATPVPPTA